MKKMLLMTVALTCAMQLSAQTAKVDDKEIVGTWLLESMQWDGEKIIVCGKEKGYCSFKFYGADGEYACCEIILDKEGNVVLLPHEYGTYTFKNGVYNEMGRPATPDGLVMTSKTSFKGRWMKRTEMWKKTVLPDNVVKYIVERCKVQNTPEDVQQQIKSTCFK